MNLLDEEGRLFGVINLIDTFAVLLAIGIVVAGAVVFVPGIFEQNEEITVQVQANNVPSYVANSTETGPVPSNDNIVAVVNKSSNSSMRTPNGTRTIIILHVRILVSSDEGELYFGNDRIYVGNQVTLDLGNVVVDGVVTDISETNN